MLQLRPYRGQDDFICIKSWIKDRRTHALWCADLLPYPVTSDALEKVLEKGKRLWGDRAYVFTDDAGKQIGFLVFSVQENEKVSFVKLVLLDDARRGQGYGTKMMKLLLEYLFRNTDVLTVRLNVFHENTQAKKCYEKAGFIELQTVPGAFSLKNEVWGRCLMAAERKSGL